MRFIVTALALAAVASAHTTFQYFQIGGQDYGAEYIRRPNNNNPVQDVGSNVMGCNSGGNVGKPKKATIAAGASFTAEFHHESRSSQGVDPSHKGPVMAYLAKVSDATTASDAGLGWFKIYHDGLSGGRWAVDKMNANGGKFSFNIPKNIASGDYLLRAETIALHAAGSYPGAQLYFGCAQITVTGGSGGSPATVRFPGAYKGTDPGIKVTIYTATSYVIPGPAVYSNVNSSPDAPAPPADVPVATIAPPAAVGAQLYAQCGGIGWAGATTCAQGNCMASGEYYSQCIP